MFQGFSQGAIDFLWGIRFNNERPWFLTHKQEYQDLVLAPLKELGAEVFDEIVKLCPGHSLHLHVSRIYRDARRLFGRGPYKDHMWFVLERPHERFTSVPALYFEIAPNYFSYGCGFWDAGTSTMAKLRRRIEERPEELSKIVRKLNKTKFVLGGEAFKRPKGDVGELLNPWYNRRNIALSYDDNPEGILFTRELKDEVVEGLSQLVPLYLYLDSLHADPEPAKD